jgi:hypothetical protein
MKSKIFVISNLWLVLVTSTYAQNVPNGGFENWENRFLYDEPESWNTGNMQSFMYNIQTASKSDDSYSGNYALRLETMISGEDTFVGLAFCNGTINGGDVSDTLQFEGGFPVSDAPDSLFCYLKYQMAENDTGIVLVSFKNGGNIIGQNIFSLIGTQNSYVKLGWEISTMSEIPDTAIVAFTCSNPDNPQTGGWLQVDSLWFGSIDDSIPNADFEVWKEASYQEPENWLTANLFSYLFGGDTCATQSEDAHSGNYAIRIESVEVMMPNDEGGSTPTVVGFGMPYSTSFNFSESTMPSFNIDFNPSEFTGYYKFEPLLNDTAMIYINLMDDEENSHDFGSYIFPVAEYTPFEIPLDYPADVHITKANIILSTTKYFMQNSGPIGEIGSVLYVDDLNLVNPCEGFPPYSIANVNYPLCDDNTALIDAGAGWDEYLWSNSETTQTIIVTITDPETFSVTVTDISTGCQLTDEIEISPPLCDAIEETLIEPETVDLCPNPSSGIFTLDFINLKPGEYQAEVIAVTGKVLFKQNVQLNQLKKKFRFDLSNYPEGLYLIKISGENFSQCKRLMIN